MDKSIFIRADELSVELDVSKALAYKMINQWNEELKAKGYTTVGGRVKPPVLLRKRFTVRKRRKPMPAYKGCPKGYMVCSLLLSGLERHQEKKIKARLSHKERSLGVERTFLLQQAADLTMTFEAFVEIYIVDKQNRLRENTWSTKEHIIRTKILPYFKEKRLCDIKPQDVIAWQNELLNYRGKNGEPYSPTYLKTLHSQFSAILNHAVRFYGLNKMQQRLRAIWVLPSTKRCCSGQKRNISNLQEVMMDKPLSYYAFEILYWCGIREGELLALTPADFDLDKGLLSITKSYQRLNGKDVITDPKTPKSIRVVQMPDFLTEEIETI